MEEKIQEEIIIPSIKVENLYKSYGKKEVLKGLNLEVYSGELVSQQQLIALSDQKNLIKEIFL